MRIIFPKKFVNLSDAIPTRFVIGVMLFTACMMSYMLRVNMSINILDMVEVDTKNSSSGSRKTSACTDVVETNFTDIYDRGVHKEVVLDTKYKSTKYDWTPSVQGFILGSYFWGYIITSLPGGMFADRWGPRVVVGWSALLSGIFTLLCPLGADLHHGVLLAFRFILGALGGVLYPSLHSLVANWAPPEEKGKFIGALMGGTFGTVITWSLCGVIISSIGWRWAFYIPGLIMLAWSVLWFSLVSNTPLDHPRINEKEKAYIMDCIGNSVNKKKALPPFKKLLFSLPFWSFIILHFGNMWGLYFLLTAAPKFIAQVLGFDISQAGVLSGLPYMSRMLMGFAFGAIGDAIRRRGVFSVTTIRKLFVVFSHFIPGILLIILTFIGCNPLLSVIIITASLGINGAATITNLQNHQDLAPNYAGTLYGIANCIGGTTGFITPAITAYFTRDNNGLAEWRIIFLIGAAAYIACGIFFIIFGTGVTQPWNVKNEEVKPETVPDETLPRVAPLEESAPGNKDNV